MNDRIRTLTADLTDDERDLVMGNAWRSRNLIGGRLSDHVATAVREVREGTLTRERDDALRAEFAHHRFR